MTAASSLPPAALASAGVTLAAEYPEWEITVAPGGIWTAYWRTADGRHRRYIVTRSAPELVAALRDAGPAR